MTHVDVIEFVSDTGEVVVKIVTDDNFAGVGAEYAFIRYKYPGYATKRQALTEASINGERVPCDELTVSDGNDEKRVFFDISDFYGRLERRRA